MSVFSRPCGRCGARLAPGAATCPVCASEGAVRRSSCRVCGALTDGSPYCAQHSAEAERLARQPWRAGYSSPEYLANRARRLEFCQGLCEECGQDLGPGAECDHLTALRDGGTNLFENLRWRCLTCHRRKTRRDRRRRAKGQR